MAGIYRTSHVGVSKQLHSHTAHSLHSSFCILFTPFKRPVTYITIRRNASVFASRKQLLGRYSLVDTLKTTTRESTRTLSTTTNTDPKSEKLISSFAATRTNNNNNNNTKNSLLSRPEKEDSKKKDDKNVKANKPTSATLRVLNTPNSSIVMHRLNNLGILDAYAPPEKMPKMFTKEYFRKLRQRSKNFWKNLIHVGLTRRAEHKLKLPADKQWKATLFKIEAVEIYKEMNRLFAEGNVKELKRICHEHMLQRLKSQLKSRSPGRYIWKFGGMVEKPRFVNVRAFQVMSSDEYVLNQVIIRIHSKQSLVVYDSSNNLRGGDPNKFQNVLEYVVFQRRLWEPDEGWVVYGYYVPDRDMSNVVSQTKDGKK
ncbi:2290_t:CDS:2 [Paraglomus brasilianum]|uniref:2290_t:CDS:1 n=1 Tax=Paraglomus brasilianum TaxID=144538 RepID=A0A9N9D9J0_9GLOM|nr:2290_t:CDS:2 [Paraglomus brasilianum]